MSKKKRKSTLDELLMEAQMCFSICIVAIAKQQHEETGALLGEFPCPRCLTGTVKWSVAEINKHARVNCTTKYLGDDGEQHSCTSAME